MFQYPKNKTMENKKTLKIGRSDFGLLLRNNHYFVDKSQLIYDFYYSANDILLMPRPKRFGKTLNLSMIEHFFDIQKPESKKLFSEFKIVENESFCQKHQNKYPVLSISLKDIKASDWEKCYAKFQIEISGLYKKHQYLLESERLTDFDKKNFIQIIQKETSQAEYEYSLKHLSEYLTRYFRAKVVVLVDEYDTPIINAAHNQIEKKGYYKELLIHKIPPPRDIIKLAIVFAGKVPYINKINI